MTVNDIYPGAPAPQKTYSVLLEGPESTVCAEAPNAGNTSSAYQSEAELEDELIHQLVAQGYERADIADEAAMVANLRARIERLNRFAFTDADWDRFFREHIARENDGIVDKTRRIQHAPVIDFTLEDGTIKNIMLIDRDHIYRNAVQVMNQYATDAGTHDNRYDVTILVNGLPLVHIELKRRGVELKQAFDQIERYQRESFWAGSGLFEYVQVFVISNGRHTKYYSNTTRWQKEGEGKSNKKASASYQFTSWWTDAANRRISDLVPFAATFLSKGTLLMVLTHYCVLDASDNLLVMRPYQICACERILNRILVSEYDRSRLGTLAAGGYIWHTTGSGKTLTSFKTAQLASRMEGVVADYNAMFRTSFSTDADGFDGYYKDVSRRMKGEDAAGNPLPASECLDILIVVNMFLTGFDAKTLNTLWVDKNLKMHGLIQAFSRTNRILNSVKSYGNIVCFRNLEEAVDRAISLFGDPEAGGIVILKPYDEYLEQYAKALAHLREAYPLGDAEAIRTDEQRRDFVNTFSTLLRMRNILASFDSFEEDDPATQREMQDYQSEYLAVRDEIRDRRRAEKESIADDLVFEMELVRQVEINIDYILMLVEGRHGDNIKDKEIAARIMSSVSASPELRDKSELIERFLAMAGFTETPAVFDIDPDAPEEQRHEIVTRHWRRLVAESMEDEIAGIIKAENLKSDPTRNLMREAFEAGGVPREGTAVSKVMAPASRFGAKAAERDDKRHRVTDRLSDYYRKFRSLTAHYPILEDDL